jgi:hypothetical protein
MTVASETCGPTKLRWTGVETSFSPGWQALTEDAVEVFYLADLIGSVNLQLAVGINYSVDLADGSSLVTVTPLAMPAAPGTVTLLRQTPAVQATDFSNLAKFAPAIHTALHDAAALRDAEIRRDLGAVSGSPDDMVDIFNQTVSARTAAQAASASAVTSAAALGNQARQYDTVPQATAATTPASVAVLVTHGLTAAGAGGRQAYIQGTSVGPGAFQDAGGIYWNLPVLYAFNSSQFAAQQLYPVSGITVPASKTYQAIGVRQASGGRNTATIGAGAQFDGFYVDLESLSGSSASSNCYAAVLHVTNSGPGTTKAIHVGANALSGSTGVIVGVNAFASPVATTNSGSAIHQVVLQQDAGVADGNVSGFNIVSSTLAGVLNNVADGGAAFNYVIGCAVTTVPVKNAFLQWAVGTASAASARFIQLSDPAGVEIQYVKKTGEVVSAVACIAGTEALGTKITSGGLSRIPTSGALVVAAGTVSGVLQLQAGGNTGLQINADGSLQVSSASIASNGSVAWSLGSVGPAGSHAAPQGALTFKDNLGTTRYVPFF